MVDQFGYRPNARKVAVIRSPCKGYDAGQPFVPGRKYCVVNSTSGKKVLEGKLVDFNHGETDAASGDRIWWFDFSRLQKNGVYYVMDMANKARSCDFRISDRVYDEVLKHAVRMFFYQRAGCIKEARYAGEGWADQASHLRPGQDLNARQGNRRDDATTERDVHGGWYDAGDYNKYTPWTNDYIENMLLAWQENPKAFGDDYGLPESGNGLPDILDEARWGLDYMLRLQGADGAVISLVNLDHASPPSAATGPSYYGAPSTTATLAAVKSFALGSVVFDSVGQEDYACQLREAALRSWQWAEQYPDSLFFTKSPDSGMGGAEVETDNPFDRFVNRATAALYLYEMTGEKTFLNIFEVGYRQFSIVSNHYTDQYQHRQLLLCLHYLQEPDAKPEICRDLRQGLKVAFSSLRGNDGYRSFIHDYNWGSNQYKSNYGLAYWLMAQIEPESLADLTADAEDYLHYLHGVNPLTTVYLTNMNGYGASRSLTEIYHAWFCDGSPLWDKVGVSVYGPPPGFLAGGPYEHFRTEQSPEALRRAKDMRLPSEQPPAKMYQDFNTSWPLNSWQLSEPSDGYQTAYIRLLSKYVYRAKNR